MTPTTTCGGPTTSGSTPPLDTGVRRNSPNRDSSSKKPSNTPLPIQGWLDAEIESRERSKRARLLKTAGFPNAKDIEGYDWSNLRMPADWGARSSQRSTSRRPLRGPRALWARRHRQDPSRGRVGQARVHARDTCQVLHRDRAAHAAAPREARGPARHGAPADRQGEAPDHRRVRLHADRRGGFQAPVPGHIGFLRDPERGLHHEHRVLRLGDACSATRTWPPR